LQKPSVIIIHKLAAAVRSGALLIAAFVIILQTAFDSVQKLIGWDRTFMLCPGPRALLHWPMDAKML
jgi:hypothetical protein